MAAAAKSVEIREQWVVLANRWQHKADAHHFVTAPQSALSGNEPSAGNEAPCLIEQPTNLGLSLSPLIVPAVTPLQNAESSSQDHTVVPIKRVDETPEDDLWSQIIADISRR